MDIEERGVGRRGSKRPAEPAWCSGADPKRQKTENTRDIKYSVHSTNSLANLDNRTLLEMMKWQIDQATELPQGDEQEIGQNDTIIGEITTELIRRGLALATIIAFTYND